MALPSYTYTFVSGTTIDSGQVNTNNTNMISNMTDGTRDFTIGSLVVTGNVTVQGNTIFGTNASDDVQYVNLTATTVPYLDASKVLKSSAVTPTELGYLTGFKMSLPRPTFRSNSSDSSQVVIPASAAKPAVVRIATTFYTNTADVTLDLDTGGVGGLDTGAKAANTAYYVYAVLPAAGSTFRGVISAAGPATGPTGFTTNWTYLGSFRTVAASAVPHFTYCNGHFASSITVSDFTATSSVITSKTFIGSAIASSVKYRVRWSTVNATGDDCLAGPASADLQTVSNASTAANVTQFIYVDVPVLAANTTFVQTTSSSDDVEFITTGWKEDPMSWQ